MATSLAAFPFVHPAIAAGALGCGLIPVVIHLINRRRHRRVPWAAMAFLLAANRRSARRMWIEQWLLLAARVLLIMLLGWTVARPYLPASAFLSAGSQRLHRVIVLDNSGSMNAVASEGQSRFEQAKLFAEQLLASFNARDAVSLVTLGEPAEAVIAHAAYDHRFVREQLASIQPSSRTTEFAAGLALVTAILNNPDVPKGNQAVYVISDFATRDWLVEGGPQSPAAAALQRLARVGSDSPMDVHLIQVAPADGGNLVVSRLATESPLVSAALPVRIEVEVVNLGSKTVAGATFQLRRDGDIVRREPLAPLAPGERVALPVTTVFSAQGAHTLEARVVVAADDVLAEDNARYLALDVRNATPILVVDGRPGATLLSGQAGYLATALSPSHTRRGLDAPSPRGDTTSPVAARVVSLGELGAEDWRRYDVIALCNVSRLSGERWAQMEAFVAAGGGLLIFAGDLLDADNYNRFGFDSGRGLLPGRFGRLPRELGSTNATTFALTAPPHPVVGEFVDHAGSGLFTARVDRYLPFSVESQFADTLLKYTDGAAAAVASRFGDGRVVVVTTSADMAWTNLPAKGDYVSLMFHFVAHLSRDRQVGRNVVVGRDATEPLTAVESSLPLRLTTPRGDAMRPNLIPIGSSLAVTYGPLDAPGFYVLSVGAQRRVTAANVPLGESLTEQADSELLEQATGLTVHSLEEFGRDPESAAASRVTELATLSIYVVLLLLFVEPLLAMWFAAARDGTTHRLSRVESRRASQTL